MAKIKKKAKAGAKKNRALRRALAGKAAKRVLKAKHKIAHRISRKKTNARRAKGKVREKKAVAPKAEPQKQKKELAAIYKRRTEMLTTALGRQQLISLGGENAISVISSFSRDMSDEELAKKAEIKVSEVRAVLNRLHSVGLVEYVREKDASSGWYSYVWRMRGDSAEKFLNYCKGIGSSGVKEEYGGKELYYCKGCGARSLIVFEEALDRGFACGCGKKLGYLEEAERIRVLGERKEEE